MKKEAEDEAAKRGEEASNYRYVFLKIEFVILATHFFSISKSIVAEMEQQMRILKLEKELERAREQLLLTRKKNYQ